MSPNDLADFFWVIQQIMAFLGFSLYWLHREVMDLDDRDPPMTDATEAPRSRRLTFLGLQFQGVIPRTGMCIVVIKF